VLLTARGTGGPPRLAPLAGADGHPRVLRARRLRTGVRVYGDERGLIVLARGTAGRRELSVELTGPSRRPGHGTSLLRAALALVPAGDPVFAAVAPGNARSLRAFLACGFAPLGSEVLIRPARAAGRPGP